MELLRDSIPMISVAVSATALFARAVSSCVTPGVSRFAMLLPVVAFFAAVPFAFSSAILRCSAALSLAWLGTFKVVLMATGRGPLDPSVPVLQFVFTATLPVELRNVNGHPDATVAARRKVQWVSIVSCTFKAAVLAAIHHLSPIFNGLHLYMRFALYGTHVWFFMELLFTCIAAAGSVLGMEVKPQFVRPYLASSLRDFWGRRWNLPVSAILRTSVYNPLRARARKEAAIMATFLVSGLMHEALMHYLTLRCPTGEMTTYFLLHGVSRVAEEWFARRWPPPPRPVATLLVLVFLSGTSFWLIFPPVSREGREEMLLVLGKW